MIYCTLPLSLIAFYKTAPHLCRAIFPFPGIYLQAHIRPNATNKLLHMPQRNLMHPETQKVPQPPALQRILFVMSE